MLVIDFVVLLLPPLAVPLLLVAALPCVLPFHTAAAAEQQQQQYIHQDQDKVDKEDTCHWWRNTTQVEIEAYQFLRQHVMTFDVPYLQTMGFSMDIPEESRNIDGLGNGLIQPVIHLALQAQQDFAYARTVPKHLWQEYVLNYAHLNEGRTSIRKLLRKRLIEPLLLPYQHTVTLMEAVRLINTNMWWMLSPHHNNNNNNTNSLTIQFVPGQTPAIFDPMSVLVYGYASCTGLAILLAEALRTAGIPCRVTGTAAWNGNRTHGNHNWVEVWTGYCHNNDTANTINPNRCSCHENKEDCIDEWSFLEPSPGQLIVDTLDRDPCERWFCHPTKFLGTQTYAARLISTNNISFPMAWEWQNRDVPAVNRTLYYQQICAQCVGERSAPK